MSDLQPPTLFEPRKLARRENPATSKDAARCARELRARYHELTLEILRTARSCVGLTADDIAEASGGRMTRHQVGRRLHELVAGGLVRITRFNRPTPSGRQARCYEAIAR